ncbi:MAG: SH3 domain-containing protein [Anaerolineae bacterium]|nr:SH3 domain-containing protein [Anaerolineae bacterium]
MADLKQQLDVLRDELEALPSSATASEIANLESQARTLLAQSKNTPFEDEARDLFAELARRSAPASPEAATVRGLLRRARIRIEIAGDEDDIDEAVDILAEALDHDPHNAETLELLQQAAERSPQLNMKVHGLLERYGLEMRQVPPAAPAVESDWLPREPAAPDTAAPSPPMSPSASLSQLFSDITQAYYSGDYQRTIELANRILAGDPENVQAQEYRQKSEDSLLRGIVPDHRIPFDARVAYNRANSLVRAGNYDEAERLYREARDLAARAGISSWKDAEQALLDIQDLALARELLAEGDRLLAADDWNSALQKYEGAMRVVPNDPLSQERIDLVQNVRQQFDQATVQLNMATGSLNERAKNLQQLLNMLAGMRQLLPGSERLKQLVREIEDRVDNVIAQLYNQAQGTLTRTDSITVLEERLRLTSEAVQALETAAELVPADENINGLLQRARQNEADMAEARHVVERAAALVAQNYENEIGQARSMLSGLRSYAQDPRYRMVVSDLLARHLERVEAALDQNDPQMAQRWLETTKDDPFRILGRRTEILRLEENIRQMQRRRYFVWLISGIVIIIVLAAVGFATQPAWSPIINPPTKTATLTPSITALPSSTPTATSSPTFTPTATWTFTPSLTPTHTWTPTHTYTPTPSQTPTYTYTPSITPTPSDTPEPTITPSITPTPSETPTPSLTPTPRILCIVSIPSGINIRTQPSSTAEVLHNVAYGQRQRMNVLQQRIGEDNQLWFRGELKIDDAEITGWVRADLVEELTDCPIWPGSGPTE